MNSETESRLLSALASLNQIGRAINALEPDGHFDQASTLRLIVESAIQVVPGAAAVIYAYDSIEGDFDPATRVSAGEKHDPLPGERPRPVGMGMRAIQQRRRILSYEEPDLMIDPNKERAGAVVVSCWPLIVSDQPLGALYVYLYEARPFHQLELLMLENFVNQAAMVFYQMHQLARVQRDLARKENELSRLRRAGLVISSSPRLEDTLRAVLQMAMEITDARYGIFRLLDPTGQFLVTKSVAGDNLGHPYLDALPIDEPSISAWVARNRIPACISDLRVEPWSSIYIPLDSDLQMRSELAVPLISPSGRLEGVINLESPQPGAFDDEDRHMLQTLATQAMVAIQEARLLDALQEIAQLLLTQPEPVVLQRIVLASCELLNARVSAIWLLDGSELVLRASTMGVELAERIPAEGSLPGLAINAQAAISLDRDLTRSFAWQPELRGQTIPARAWAHPLVTQPGNQPIGAFCVYSAADNANRAVTGGTEWENKILSCLAHYASLAVYNARHQNALQEAQEQRAVAEMFAAVGDIATNLLHQLNNKIGTIPVRIQGIQDKCELLLEQDRYLSANLAEIERSATEAMEAVRRNLTHLHPVRRVPVNISMCVQQALTSARLGPEVKVRLQGLDNLPPVAAAQQNLALVFTNLFENAGHAMNGRGRILVSGSHRSGWVEVSVADTGPGIPPEDHARIFDLSYSSGTQPGKLGFGLWWVRTQVVRLGGTVVVESDGRNGSTFRIRLPAGLEAVEGGMG